MESNLSASSLRLRQRPDPAVQQLLSGRLEKREAANALRSTRVRSGLADFCSNDYLGLARNISTGKSLHHGSTGSRLISGTSPLALHLEQELAEFHDTEAALLFNSGYDANLGLFSALGQKEVTYLYDELIHASVIDGIRLSGATSFRFRHNDLDHLAQRLRETSGIRFVAVESIYSMDGDRAPLDAIVRLCEQEGASLIVDEAHATGITRNNGTGVVQELSLQDHVFARVHTFGKAVGAHGAVVVGSQVLREYLVNFARSFIYTTALPDATLHAISHNYSCISPGIISRLWENIDYFDECCRSRSLPVTSHESPIRTLRVNGNAAAREFSERLATAGLDVRPILSPTVPTGTERLRICIHAFNTRDEISLLVDNLGINS